MKFDLPEQTVNTILQVLQDVPVPFKVVNPLIMEIMRQANDPKIQSLVYPPEPAKGEPNG